MKNLCIFLFWAALCMGAAAQTAGEHPWRNKRVAYLGDSVTDPRNMASTKKYWNFLADWLNITSYVYGVSGRQWNDIPRQTDKLKAEHGDNVDAIVVFVGTNDFNAAVPIGAPWVECDTLVEAAVHAPKAVVKRKMRLPNMDTETLWGRINTALAHLKTVYPDKQVVMLTPLHRSFARFSDTNVQPSEAYQNACGVYLEAYADAICRAGRMWSVPVIDLGTLSGLYPLLPSQAHYFGNKNTDLLHPNNAGHERMAHTLFYQLQMLPCTF